MDINKNIKDFNRNIKGFNDKGVKIVKTHLPLPLQYIFGVYFLGLFFMMLYRLANFTVHCFISFSDLNFILLIKSLLIGIRFDTIVLCYILVVFLILMSLGAVLKINKKWFYRPLHLIICFIFCLVYFVTAIDVAYFSYFKSHINIIALSWIQSPSYIGALILRHPIYLVYFSVFLFSLVWYIWLMYCLYNATLFKVLPPYKVQRSLPKTIALCLLSLALCGWGMYGKIIPGSSLDISSASFSDSDFFNQLATNTIFNLQKSIKEEYSSSNAPLTVLDGLTTRNTVEEQFILKNDIPASCPVLPPSSNIVAVMMENVSLDDVTYSKMPNLSSISTKSLSFTSVYPDGDNYYNGIFSVLFAYPNIFSANSMKSAVVPKFDGIASYLSFKKYRNIFFIPQSQKTNGISGFLYHNDFHEVIIKENITKTEEINKLSSLSSNFFACILVNNDGKDNSLKQTDKYIKNFLDSCKQTAWFKKTAFVFVGLNGKDKVPLIVYMPDHIKTKKIDNIATQTDIAPTLSAMISRDYNNDNTLGLNIFSSQREFAVSSYAHSAVCQDSVWKYVWRDSGKESLYLHGSDKNGINYIKAYPQQAQKMKEYLFSMLQYTQYTTAELKLKRK